MDFIWVIVAFVCGLAMKLVDLPPLIGFLIAGFALNFAGVEPAAFLSHVSDMGITLMLFLIGLKIHIEDLLKKEVWLAAATQTGIWVIASISSLLVIGTLGISYFSDLSLETAALIGFALSFSSTVCIVKLLEEANELKTRHGQISLGILVMQDIIAVGFLVVATGMIPSLWAIGLLALIPLRPLLFKLLEKSGHGELLPLSGLFIALGGYELFYAVGIKGDLGALIMGMLLSSHRKGAELNKSLAHFKDLFLVGFFLSIGFTALPTWNMLGISLLLCLLLPIKFLVLYFVMNGMRLRGRTSFLSALMLTNYSEFGLIVGALAVNNAWLPQEWLVILALSASISFLLTSFLYRYSHTHYASLKQWLFKFEHQEPLAQDRIVQPTGAEILVIGLGRVGRSAFRVLNERVGDKVAGLDADHYAIDRMQEEGLHVYFGDAEDPDFWRRLDTSHIKLVLLALPLAKDCIYIEQLLNKAGYQGQVAAIARFRDERDLMVEQGIANVFNFYTEVGSGFAEDSLALINYADAS